MDIFFRQTQTQNYLHKTLYLFSWDYSRSLGLSEAIVFHILGVFIDSMNMGGL
jgi:hypothetical protein